MNLARQPFYFIVIVGLGFSFLTGGCASPSQHVLGTDQSQVMLRNIQSRAFDTTDQKLMMRSVINTLQDLDFLILDANADLGTVTGQKFQGNTVVKMSVNVRERSAAQLLVRANAQYGLKAIEDPVQYQQFFSALEKSVFLTAQQVD